MRYLIIICLFLAGCSLQEWCYDKYPPKVEKKTDTVYKYKDTIIHYGIPDTIKRVDTVIIEKGLSQSEKLQAETDYCFSYSQVIDGRLYHDLEQREVKIDSVLTKLVTITETEICEIEINKLYWWQTALMYFGGLFIVYLIIRAIF